MHAVALKHRLLDKGITLVELASRIGLSYDRLIKIVNGYREPRPEEIERIALVLAMTPEELNTALGRAPRRQGDRNDACDPALQR